MWFKKGLKKVYYAHLDPEQGYLSTYTYIYKYLQQRHGLYSMKNKNSFEIEIYILIWSMNKI